jgi:glycosyltransferase involved in cell wall biosynthesis
VNSNEITVSVIVSTYNRAHYLPAALDSLLAQQRPPEEIIVIDDHSIDATGEVLDRYGDRIRVIRNEENKGKPAALNRAIPLAQGSHIWIFDDDDVALPEALQAHVDYLQAHPDIDFSYSDKFIYQRDGDIWNRDAWHIERMPQFPPEEFLVRTMESMNTLMQGMLIPGRCYQAVGLFDESIQRSEDHDILLRLARRFRAGNVGRPTFVYRDHAGARGSASDFHAGNERFVVLFRYRQEIFRRMHA